MSYINAHMWNLKNGTDELVCKAEIETQMQRTNISTKGGKWQGGGGGWDELGDWD